jgi:arylsulfatase A-like enzyme
VTPARRRRTAAIVLALVVAAGVATIVAVRRGGGARLNVLLLVMDTTRADRCSFLGYGRPTTPRLAEFAKDAAVFRAAWTPAGWTGPAHASLFTALRPEHHGYRAGERNYLWERPATLAERFAAAGWSTACFSNNEFVSPDFGLARGFAKHEPLYKDEHRAYPWARATHDAAAAWAEAQARDGKPFLLFVNDMEPHMPYAPPAEERRRFVRGDATDDEVADASRRTVDLAGGLGDVDARRAGILSDLYDAELATLDREVGVLLDRLAADGLLDTTIVVIVGDHGESLGEHDLFGHGAGPDVGMYAVIRRVPLLVRLPGVFDGGRVIDAVVRLEDVAPTLLEACGLAPLSDVDGAPLTRDLAGRVARGMMGGRGGGESAGGATPVGTTAGVACVADDRRHLLAFANGRDELYDVVADPLEREDLSRREPQEVARLRALLPR